MIPNKKDNVNFTEQRIKDNLQEINEKCIFFKITTIEKKDK